MLLAHYAEGIEKERLRGEGAGHLEYLRTRELLARYLPLAGAWVLNVGGGAEAYALPLAKEGYSVYLVDPVPLHAEQATAASVAQPEAPLVGVEVGDARSLSQEDESVEAVLLLGPLCHLTLRNECLMIAIRVRSPTGVKREIMRKEQIKWRCSYHSNRRSSKRRSSDWRTPLARSGRSPRHEVDTGLTKALYT